MKRFTHDADLRGMVVLRSLGFQLVPFKLHRFRKQRRVQGNHTAKRKSLCGSMQTPSMAPWCRWPSASS
ncbi:hypothetical protein GO993_14595 [Aeromonas salmonicida subsp. salmonicida]|uniref:hypothetical protein n=1 Tax=Aeromonas salmonicida TaxID=645 RepID=UPI00131F95CF|nr:hypothetical protein [Aeromonas salmonicida]QHE49059.1 hypothetical protein GO994_19060 [Aeromonas salmonicida subsp. salmonicida]QJF56546.1 hypothetical protein GO993_14595 [Aeromonas salmonicida subsp. salmonicida]